jgi:Na+:H+ antiporter
VDLLHFTLFFLLAAAVIAVAAERIRLPYTTALVLVGLAVGLAQFSLPITITPQGLFTLLILPVLFDGGLHLSLHDLLAHKWLVALLALPGTILAAAVIFGAGLLLWHLPLRSAFLLGAIVSATDPVGVIALASERRLDRRLSAILEAEAVFNDAVAIVLFTIGSAPVSPGLLRSVGQFVWLLGGGGIVGIAAALAIIVGLSRVHLHLVESLGSVILAIGVFIAADTLGTSGVIAVVLAGVVLGNYGPSSLTEAGHQTLETLWDVITFVANSALFLLIGLATPIRALVELAGPIGVIILASLAARAASVYGFAAAFGGRAIPKAWQHVMVWGGLRGGVAIALVLDLPKSLPGRYEVVAATYGLIVFTLVVQGLSMGRLMRRVGLLTGAEATTPA